MSSTPGADPDRRLQQLLASTVEDVEPTDRLGSIRARTAPARRPTGTRRPWAVALVAAVAVAGVVTGVVTLGGLVDGPREAAGPATSPGPAPTTAATSIPPVASSTVRPPTPSGGPAMALPVYYLVDTERAGVRLVREFRAANPVLRLDEALALMSGPALDPDYRTSWPAGSFLDAGFDGVGDEGVFSVTVSEGVLDRPAGMSDQEARAALEQVVRTLQGVAQTIAPVQFRLPGGAEADELLGVPLDGPVARGSTLELLNHLNLTSPEQGQVVDARVRLSGVASSFEASVAWEIRQDERVLLDGTATAGWEGDRLHPFEQAVDVSDLPAGDYTVWASTDDPTAGTEGVGAMTDTKEFTIR